jgi:hypothetical protein
LLIRWKPENEVSDLRQYVYNSFKAHNKDIGLGVEHKITNTEFTLRFMQQKELENSPPPSKGLLQNIITNDMKK